MDSLIVSNQAFAQDLILGMPGWIQILFVLVLVPLGFIIYKFIMNEGFRKDVIGLVSSTKPKKMALNKHELFSYKSISETYIDRLDMGSDLKNCVFKIILEKKVSTIIRNSEYFLVRYERHIKNDDKISLRFELSDLVSRSIKDYEKAIYGALKKKYPEDFEFLYKHIYKDSFENYHSMNIAYILKVVDRFSNTKISKDQKVNMFFNLVYVCLDIAVLDCERTFRDLNGSLKKLEDKYGK